MRIRYSSLFGAIALILLTAVAAVAQNTSGKRSPNIVVLFADDLGWADVGFNGRKEWKTPNIDKLARDGTMFRRWYTAGVVCAPSRAALMTGKYGIHNGVSGNNDDLPRTEVTIARALKDRGYATALFGKWHHGAPRPGETTYIHPMDRGFDEFFGFTSAVDAWQHFPKELYDGRELKPVSGYADTLFADHAIDFIQRNRDRPFFLYVPFTAPHLLMEAPEEDIRRYRGKFKEKDPAHPYNAIYAAMISRLDTEIGRIVKALDTNGLGKDTLIVFTSDHGATFESGNKGTSAFHDSNRPFRGQKRTLWEGGIRVPAAVRWTGKIPAGKISDAVVHMTDLFPTFLKLANGTPETAWKVDGTNLLPMWLEGHTLDGRVRFWEWRVEGANQIAAMRDNLKLVITHNGPPELFDVVADPGERRNLYAELPKEGQELRRLLMEWLKTETVASKWGKSISDF